MFDSREVQVMGDEELVDALRRAHGAAAFAQAAEITAVRELYRRHRAANAAPGAGGVRAGEFAAAEVAVAVQISEPVAAALIDIGLALDELPGTRKAFGDGRIDLARVQVIAETTRGLAREVREAVEPKLIDAATRNDPARLRQTARRWVARLDPDGERERREEREHDRDVRIRAVQDGMAVFDGLLPAVGAQTVANRLRELCGQVCAEDPRTMPQRRADALVALADGSQRLWCACGRGARCPKSATASGAEFAAPRDTTGPAWTERPATHDDAGAAETERPATPDSTQPARNEPPAPVGGTRSAQTGSEAAGGDTAPSWTGPATRRDDTAPGRIEPAGAAPVGPGAQPPRPPLIQIGVSAESLAGLRNDPAMLVGYGPIDTTLARELAKYARFEVVPEPPAPEAGARRPTSTQSPEDVRAIDGVCRFPGCGMPATDAQLAYVEATNARPRLPGMAHVAALCTRHHRLKMLADRGSQAWRVRRADADRIVWTDPSGETHTTTREGARYLFPHTDIDAPTVPPTPYERVHVRPPQPVRTVPADLTYPIDGHALIHPQLSRCTPDNDIPDDLPVNHTASFRR
ncbi:DUF222 domain-containing protein [Nocardia otitidiscaviarum]|uniref:DUF222 domain-containing protein n=1 Tax=Nocardia otitidiscaviarum TaxID=1823 RepID=A0A516NH44_9NOCA|nr:DUF222 domain-containing protein [Nocardia otitidiscaviarum]MCP9625180.1 DUF222 domain-containing protein [Nocardia otitidiscaviarum]QDP78221.1 DUF222 domain-containing protein [Nocardia otitidiscaviarum]